MDRASWRTNSSRYKGVGEYNFILYSVNIEGMELKKFSPDLQFPTGMKGV